MRAVITAGGTSEPIDEVRVVTNLSGGRFGAALANVLADRGHQVTLLASRGLASHPEWIDRRVQVIPFLGFVELREALFAEIRQPPDALYMAAAVADYSPTPALGKVSSEPQTLQLTLHKNPKLLAELRARCGVTSFLVGFKLLSGAPEPELIAAALRQVKANRLNLVVANDRRAIGAERHPVLLVTPEGGVLPRDGSKAEVAAAVVDFVERRMNVRWHRSVRAGEAAPTAIGHAGAAALLELGVEARLWPGTDGNVSHQSDRGLWTTPRQVTKAALTPADLVHAEVGAGTVRWWGAKKPSIDTAVHAALYRRLPRIAGLLHFHQALVLPTATTTFPWPCGTVEEADEIHRALLERAWRGGWDGGDFAVKLVDHGFLLGVRDPRATLERWRAVRDGYLAHLGAIGAAGADVALSPIFDGAEPIGVAAEAQAAGAAAWSIWLDPAARGGGRGDRIAELVDRERRAIVANDQCDVIDWYAERGFLVTHREGPFVRLIPPSLRSDLIDAASVCLIDPLARRVLVGRRKVGPWPGYWAFPGGKRATPEEPLLGTALRELEEETGITVEHRVALEERVIFAGGAPGYRVHNFVVPVLDEPAPRSGDELEAEWKDLDSARRLKPMAAGTRRVLWAIGVGPIAGRG